MTERQKKHLLNQIENLHNEIEEMIEKDGGKWEIKPLERKELMVWCATFDIYKKHYLDLITKMDKIYEGDEVRDMMGESKDLVINSFIQIRILIRKLRSFVKFDLEYKDSTDIEERCVEFDDKFRKIDDQLFKIHGDITTIKKEMNIKIIDEDKGD